MKNQNRVRSNGEAAGASKQARKRARSAVACEVKVISLRECPAEQTAHDDPEKIAEFWWRHVESADWFRQDKECACVIFLDTRRRVIGFELAGIGTLDSMHIHARDVFRAAIVKAAASVVLAHNHPSGVTTPSEADIRVTRDLMQAGQLLKIELLDSIVMGRSGSEADRRFSSLRSLGYFGAVKSDAPAPEPAAIAPAHEATAPAACEAWNTWQRMDAAIHEVKSLHHAMISLMDGPSEMSGDLVVGLQSLGWRTQAELDAIYGAMRSWVSAERVAKGWLALPEEGRAAA